MTKRKVCVVITARPSYARIKTAMEAIRDHKDLELQLVVAASALLDRYGNAVKVIEAEGFKIDRTVYMIVEGENLVTSAKSTGFGLAELATVFNDLKPDAVVTIADRYETIGHFDRCRLHEHSAGPCARRRGHRLDRREDAACQYQTGRPAHLVSCQPARVRVEKLGERLGSIHVTGCPSIDLARLGRWNKSRVILLPLLNATLALEPCWT